MTLAHRTTIEPEGLLRLIAPFWGRPRMATILVTMLEGVQDLHDQIWTVIDRWDVDTAPYLTLSWLAKWVGETRRPATADALRTLVKGRIMANRSSGTFPDLYALSAALFAGSDFAIENRLSVAIYITDPGVSDPAYAVSLLDDAAMASVATALITSGSFAFPDISDLSPPTTGAMGTGTWSDRHGDY